MLMILACYGGYYYRIIYLKQHGNFVESESIRSNRHRELSLFFRPNNSAPVQSSASQWASGQNNT